MTKAKLSLLTHLFFDFFAIALESISLLKSIPIKNEFWSRFFSRLNVRSPVPQQRSTVKHPLFDCFAQAFRHLLSNPNVKNLLQMSYVSATVENMGLSMIVHLRLPC